MTKIFLAVAGLKMEKKPVVIRLFEEPPVMELKMASPGPIHGLPEPIEESPAARVAFISDGILTHNKIEALVKANRLVPDPKHDEPPILFRAFGQAGLKLTDLATDPEDPFSAMRRQWAEFRADYTFMAVHTLVYDSESSHNYFHN